MHGNHAVSGVQLYIWQPIRRSTDDPCKPGITGLRKGMDKLP